MKVEDLVVQYAGWIRRHAFKYYSTPAEADDLASETILRALDNQEKYNPDYRFTTWVSAIMKNTYITEYNRRLCVSFDEFQEYSHSTLDMGVEETFCVRNIRDTIHRLARKSINMECLQYYADGYSYQEIADIVGISIGTVKSRIANGRKMLRDALDSW